MELNVPSHSLGLKAQEALSVIHDLRCLGLDADVDLPRICVVGKQSSGKSSVMEALTGIAVPRASGTCTRCAFEISTKYASVPFQCVVTARCQSNGETSRERIKLATTDDPSQVPVLLGDAQKFLLNKSKIFNKHGAKLKDGSASLALLKEDLAFLQSDEDSFTRDVVVVEVQGEAFTDLELIDLPGLIQSVEKDEDEPLISLIQELCSEYLKKSNTLIAMCCPFNDDMENQAVRMLARKHDPDGKRTIGVLTKADLLPEGAEAEWIPVLKNSKFTLHHGYFALRNPPQSELDKHSSQENAREQEKAFFEDHALGKRLQAAAESRCGLLKLRTCLSQLLRDLIDDQFPALRHELTQGLIDAQHELYALGDIVQPTEARTRLVAIVDDLKSWFNVMVEAQHPEHFDLWSSVRMSYNELREACYAARPVFTLKESILDDSDLNPGKQNSSEIHWVVLRSWQEWHTLTAKLDSNQVVTGDVSIGGASLHKGFSASPPAWQTCPFKQGIISSGNIAYACGECKLPLAWGQGWKESKAHDIFYLAFETLKEKNLEEVGENRFRVLSNSYTKYLHLDLYSDKGSTKSGYTVRVGTEVEATDEGDGWVRVKRNQVCTYQWRPAELVDANGTWPVTLVFQNTVDKHLGKEVLTMPNVRQRIQAVQGREINLPGGPAAYRAAQQIVCEAQRRWHEPATRCVEDVSKKLEDMIDQSTSLRLGVLGKLSSAIVDILKRLVEVLRKEVLDRKLQILKKHELAPDLFTLNDHYLLDSFQNAQQHIRSSLKCTVDLRHLSDEEKVEFVKLAKKAHCSQDVSKLVAGHPDDDSIWCMAAAYAYHKVAFKRFCDTLPRTIDDMLLRELVQRSRNALIHGLKIMESSDEDLCTWFSEDSATAKRRKELEDKAKRHCEGLRRIEVSLAGGQWA